MLVNGTSQGAARLDPIAALDMQKLLPCIQQADPAAIKQHQRHIEDCLTSLLLSGVSPPVSPIGSTTASISSWYVCTSVHKRSIAAMSLLHGTASDAAQVGCYSSLPARVLLPLYLGALF